MTEPFCQQFAFLQLIGAFTVIGLDDTDGMNLLQQHGVISDCCIMPRSVPDRDVDRAMRWLANHFRLAFVAPAVQNTPK